MKGGNYGRQRRGRGGIGCMRRMNKNDLSHNQPKPFTLGVCAMEAKIENGPMQSILKRLQKSGDFEIIQFSENVILHEDIKKWPKVDCLMAFHSSGYPLKKVGDYVKYVKPVTLNDVEAMRHLRSRIDVFQMLKKNGIPTPSHIIVNHNLCNDETHVFEEHYDYIVYNGLRLNKPFIEKPEDADNHNNYVYYPRNTGGGCKKLFRKIKDRSSAFYSDIHQVRRDGIYVYEEFLATFGTDVKVYTVGQIFAHAEARKAPTLDGKVQRTSHGKEVRYPVILSETEKYMAYKIVETFKQTVCGFDILRTTSGQSYVCDVNGWSFVKGNVKYYNDCAHIIRILFLNKLQEKYNFIPRELPDGWLTMEAEEETLRKTFIHVNEEVLYPNDPDEELRTVVVVMRHGDRKPKQKLKFETSELEILAYHKQPCPITRLLTNPKKEVKLKSPEELQELLEKTRTILKRLALNLSQDCIKKKSLQDNFHLLQRVLERGDGFTGINRKFQIKPVAWEEIESPLGEKILIVTKEMIVAKWGGELTRVGRAQAEDLGQRLRAAMYPGDDAGGLLRLHSTFRHDLKIYTSDEGRCQVTSAAFTKGFLDLEGELTPILVQMVVRNAKAHSLLDSSPIHIEAREQCKLLLDTLINETRSFDELSTDIKDTFSSATGFKQVKHLLENPRHTMIKIQHLITQLLDALSNQIKQFDSAVLQQQMTFINDIHQIGTHHTIDTHHCCNHEMSQDLTTIHSVAYTEFDAQYTPIRHDSCETKDTPPLSSFPLEDTSMIPLQQHPSEQMMTDDTTNESYESGLLISRCSSCRLVVLLSGRLKEIQHRWKELSESWYKEKTDRFDSTKIPDIVDNIRFDLIHHHTHIGTAALHIAFELYKQVEPLGNFIAPAEYGLTPHQKAEIGTKLISKLLKKILADVTFFREPDESISSNPFHSVSQRHILPTTATTSPSGQPLFVASTPRTMPIKKETLGNTYTPYPYDSTTLNKPRIELPIASPLCPIHHPIERLTKPCIKDETESMTNVKNLNHLPMDSSPSIHSFKKQNCPLNDSTSGIAYSLTLPNYHKPIQPPDLSLNGSTLTRRPPPPPHASCHHSSAVGCSTETLKKCISTNDTEQRDLSSDMTNKEESTIIGNHQSLHLNGIENDTPGDGVEPKLINGNETLYHQGGMSNTVIINTDSLWGHQQPHTIITQQQRDNTNTSLGIRNNGNPSASFDKLRPAVLPNSISTSSIDHSLQLNTSSEIKVEQDSGILQPNGRFSGMSTSRSSSIDEGSSSQGVRIKRVPPIPTQLMSDEDIELKDICDEDLNESIIHNDDDRHKDEEDDEHDDDTVSQFRLKEEEAKQMGIKSPWRIVRSRYYVASASHIMSLFNIIMHGSNVINQELNDTNLHFSTQDVSSCINQTIPSNPSLLSPTSIQSTSVTSSSYDSGLSSVPINPRDFSHTETAPILIDNDVLEAASKVTDVHYLSHVVFRVWEKRGLNYNDPQRFRLEIQFSSGAKDGFGSNYALLREHAQGKQSIFEQHLNHLLTHHVKNANITNNKKETMLQPTGGFDQLHHNLLCSHQHSSSDSILTISKQETMIQENKELSDSKKCPTCSYPILQTELLSKRNTSHNEKINKEFSSHVEMESAYQDKKFEKKDRGLSSSELPILPDLSIDPANTMKKSYFSIQESRQLSESASRIDCESLLSEPDEVAFYMEDVSDTGCQLTDGPVAQCYPLDPYYTRKRNSSEIPLELKQSDPPHTNDIDNDSIHSLPHETEPFVACNNHHVEATCESINCIKQNGMKRFNDKLRLHNEEAPVPPYCEINPLLRLTKNCPVVAFETVAQTLLRRLGPNLPTSSSAASHMSGGAFVKAGAKIVDDTDVKKLK